MRLPSRLPRWLDALACDPGRARWIACVSAVVLVLVALATPQGIDSDPGWQLRAVQQFGRGESPTPNTMTMPDATDLSRNRLTWISLWAPGPVLLTYPLTRLGLSLGASVRTIVAASLILGAAMWARWFGLFGLPAPVLAWLAAAVPWMRYVSNGLFVFMAETLVFAIAPCVLLAAYSLGSRWRRGEGAGVWRSIGAGSLFALAYILKYSTLLAMSGLAIALMAVAVRSVKTGRMSARRIAAEFGAFGAVLGGVVLGLSVVNRTMGAGMNVVTETFAPTFRVEHIVAAIAAPPMMFGDLNALLHAILSPPSQVGVPGETILLMGLPCAAIVIWVVVRERAGDWPGTLAIAATLSTVVALAVLWNIADVSFEARHVSIAALAMLPLALRAGLRAYRTGRPMMKVALVATAMVFVALPQVYGVLSVPVKIARYRHGYKFGPSGLYDPTLAPASAAACRSQLIDGFDPARDVWYAIDPSTSLDLPGRVLIEHADFLDRDWLRRFHYQTSQPLVLHVLLPPRFEAEGKGAVIRASFAGAGIWTERVAHDCDVAEWRAALTPVPMG